MTLSQHNKNIIKNLSRRDVEKTLVELKRFTKNSRWITKNNRYSSHTISKITADMKSGGIKNSRHLSHYIVTSGILHCADGWSYLGKSILSLLRGDPHRARHLAYYAELRAAMSLLGASGIGVFNLDHFVINAPQTTLPLKGKIKTHTFVWDCLLWWAQQRYSGDLFTAIIRPNGRSLNDWLAPTGGGSTVAPQARAWFRQWGMDLEVLAKDHLYRNESSYRPDGIPDSWSLDAAASIQFVKELWTSLEPSSSSFNNIDRHILRLSVESIFKSRTGIPSTGDPIGYTKFVEGIIAHQNFPLPVAESWVNFLTRKKDADDPRLFAFSRLKPRASSEGVFPIIARAMLLLRVAAGSNALLLHSAGYDSESIDFWWHGLGHDRGLWDTPPDSDELADLWGDISDCLEQMENFQKKYDSKNQTFFKFGLELGNILVTLGSCERVAIWSAAPN